MQTRNRLFDDLAKMTNSAVNLASGLKGEIDARVNQRFERVLDGMELVSRDEFEAIKATAVEARAENERLSKRLAKLEAAAPKIVRRVGRSRFSGKGIYPLTDGKNPRRENSHGWRAFKIVLAKPGIPYEEYMESGGASNHLIWDVDHKFVEVR